MTSFKKNNEIDRLKFKYAEYLIGNFKKYNDIINYMEKQFNLLDISKNKEKILSLDRFGFIRQTFYKSSINKELKINRNNLTIYYFIIKNSELSKLYMEEENLDNIYFAVCKELNNFHTNSILINHELKIFQGISKYDIENKTDQLYSFLKALEEDELTAKVKTINPQFITPEEKKAILEKIIIEKLNQI